jgi:hypothetical protein
MLPKKLLLSVAVLGALGMAGIASSASAATIVNVGTLPPANPYFYLTSGTPTSPTITANFGATISGASTTFDDIFQFTIPQDGKGSGSLSTSFSSPMNQLTIGQVLVNGISYALTSSSGGQSLTVSGIPILNGVMNTIEVKGTNSASAVAATYTGTATFAAGAVPEPASWAMMIGGFGLIGAAMRRRRPGFQLA